MVCTCIMLLCFSGVVLAKDGGALSPMLIPFKLGLGGPIGTGNQWFPWIHIADLVGIFMHAMTNGNVSGVLNGVAPVICTNEQFTRKFSTVLHRPAFIRTPAFVLNTLFGPIRASMLLEGQNVYPKRTLDSGYTYKFPSIDMALTDLFRTNIAS